MRALEPISARKEHHTIPIYCLLLMHFSELYPFLLLVVKTPAQLHPLKNI